MLDLLAESWTWYACATLVVCARYISRWLQLGSIKDFQVEDYIMVLVFGFFTSLVVVMNIVDGLETNLMTASTIPLLTPEDIKSRIHGSKLVLVIEQCMIMTQWGCKTCLLLLYNKLTSGLKQQLAVKIVGAYVLITFLVMEALYFGVWCRPFDQYWAVPVANEQCSTALHHLITNAVFNTTSDIMMLCIPIPLLLKSKLPHVKKGILCGLFGLGVFVIMCAVVNKYSSFYNPFSPLWEFWYIREGCTAILVANIPMCWTLMRRLFKLHSFNGATSSNGQRSRSTSKPIATIYNRTNNTQGRTRPLKSKLANTTNSSWWDRRDGWGTRNESEEYIIDGKGRGREMPLKIRESTVVEVDRVERGMCGPLKSENYDGGVKEFESMTVVTAGTSSPRMSEIESRNG